MRLVPCIAALLLAGGALAAGPPSAPPTVQLVPLTRPAWLGVEMETNPVGVRVTRVIRTSPADRAGIKDGDRIVKVDGVDVTTPTELVRIIGAHVDGDVVTLAYSRDGHDLTTKVSLVGRPTADDMMRMQYVGTFAPAWTNLALASGTAPTNLQALRGKVIVLEFWATWCGPCRMTAPVLSALQGKYGAQGASVVGITTDSVETASLFAQKSGMTFSALSDSSGSTSQAYSVRSLPTLFMIDKRGVIREVLVGYEQGHDAQVERMLQALLAEPAPVTAATP